MESFQPEVKQSVVERLAFGEVPTGDAQLPDSRYGRFGSLEGFCDALCGLLDTMTCEEAERFIEALEAI